MRYTILTIMMSVLVTGCDNSPHRNNDTDNTANPSVLLIGGAAGKDELGAVYSVEIGDLSKKTLLHEASGAHTIFTDNRSGHSGLVFNSRDNKFWGVANPEGVGGGKLFSFDPASDELVYHRVLEHAYTVGSTAFASGWLSRPTVLPGGKAILMSAREGGRNSIGVSAGGHGDGVLVHINIDETSADFGKLKIVYEYYEGGYVNVITPPVFGEYNGKNAVLLVAEGARWRNPDTSVGERGTRTFILTPTNNADLSQPWEIAWTRELSSNYSLGLTSVEPLYDEVRKRFVWSRFDAGSGELHVNGRDHNGADWSSNIISQITFEAHWSFSVFQIGPYYYHLSPGFERADYDTYPDGSYDARILRLVENDFPFSMRAFPEWQDITGDGYKHLVPQGFVVDNDASKLYLNVGIAGGDTLVDGSQGDILKDFYFAPSRIEVVDAANNFARTTLFEGKPEFGEFFVGQPALGGAASEPIPNRYLVQYAYGKGDFGKGSLVKYDRLFQSTSYVSLGSNKPRGYAGKPLVTDSAIIIATTPASLMRMSKENYSVQALDVGTVPATNPDGGGTVKSSPRSFPNFVTLDDGDIWSLSVGAGSALSARLTSLWNINSQGESQITNTSNTHHNGNWSSNIFHRYTLASLGNILVFPESYIDPSGNADKVHITCTNQPEAGEPAFKRTSLSSNTLNVVRGLAAHDDNKLYGAITDSSTTHLIAQIDVGDCSGTPVVNEGFADVAASLSGARINTAPLSASDGLLYFGTSSGYLASFDPDTQILLLIKDVSGAAGSSGIVGYLTEVEDGVIMGVVDDRDVGNNSVKRRLFKYTISTNLLEDTDVSDIIHGDEYLPGVVRLN
ncbi:TPA: PQQ-binding-like beta-propeller repeat protein [Vibrio vulnificus]|nr:PQQ-binding-like beta-propeller repeat protein [Vibrio vulnificus]